MEKELIEKITVPLPFSDDIRFQTLLKKNRESLSQEESDELLEMVLEREEANVLRVEAAYKLSQLRGTSLNDVWSEFHV